MIIICEGIDKAGKSSVIQDLTTQNFVTSVVFKISQKPRDNSLEEQIRVKVAYDELFAQALRLSRSEGKTVIFDRGYPSEMVYSAKRGYDALANEYWWNIDKMYRDASAVIIYCHAPKDVISKRFVTDNEEFAQHDEIDMLLDRYESFISKTTVPVLKIDSTESRQDNIVKIQEFLKTRK